MAAQATAPVPTEHQDELARQRTRRCTGQCHSWGREGKGPARSGQQQQNHHHRHHRHHHRRQSSGQFGCCRKQSMALGQTRAFGNLVVAVRAHTQARRDGDALTSDRLFLHAMHSSYPPPHTTHYHLHEYTHADPKHQSHEHIQHNTHSLTHNHHTPTHIPWPLQSGTAQESLAHATPV